MFKNVNLFVEILLLWNYYYDNWIYYDDFVIWVIVKNVVLIYRILKC